jgi:ElaB/YqjD/DUF883 family membrane-anchored ribosome-binding protein
MISRAAHPGETRNHSRTGGYIVKEDHPMNDTMENNEARETAGLLDADGRPIGDTARSSKDVLTQFDRFVHEEPLKAVIIAIGIGYIMGRLRLII